MYSYEVLVKARKHKLDLAAAGLPDEKAVREHASTLAAALEPAVVFEYLPPEDEAAARISGSPANRLLPRYLPSAGASKKSWRTRSTRRTSAWGA